MITDQVPPPVLMIGELEGEPGLSQLTEWTSPLVFLNRTVSPTLADRLAGENEKPVGPPPFTASTSRVCGPPPPPWGGGGVFMGMVGQGWPEGSGANGGANSPPLTIRSEPIMPSIMWASTWQCMCHSPNGGRARMKLLPSSIVKKNELAGPNTRVSSNCETAVSMDPPNWRAVVPVPLGPGMTQRWP